MSSLLLPELLLDSNCVRVHAPARHDENNRGHFASNEHIGRLGRNYAAKLASILDSLSMPSLFSFDRHVTYKKGLRIKDHCHEL